jgi:hypothetical protein
VCRGGTLARSLKSPPPPQGRLGNCYYLAAISSCAEGEDDVLLKDLIIEDGIAQVGSGEKGSGERGGGLNGGEKELQWRNCMAAGAGDGERCSRSGRG